MSTIDWNTTVGAVWRHHTQSLRAVRHLDPILPEQLLGVDRQKARLIENTERFLNGQPANNALLWGSRGTGKSSLIKAMLNAYADQGLRMLEVDKDDLIHLPEIVDEIRELPYRFVIFCDDLSFEAGEKTYKALKSVLEGSLELPPDNVLIYASSNRRHLLPETQADNQDVIVVGTELHLGDAIEEKISLSDRFGLWLSFYPINQDAYLNIIDHLFDHPNETEQLHKDAIRFAHEKGVRSGRTAKQFFKSYTA
jgi:predicted AAA+ superfamily ATPase